MTGFVGQIGELTGRSAADIAGALGVEVDATAAEILAAVIETVAALRGIELEQ